MGDALGFGNHDWFSPVGATQHMPRLRETRCRPFRAWFVSAWLPRAALRLPWAPIFRPFQGWRCFVERLHGASMFVFPSLRLCATRGRNCRSGAGLGDHQVAFVQSTDHRIRIVRARTGLDIHRDELAFGFLDIDGEVRSVPAKSASERVSLQLTRRAGPKADPAHGVHRPDNKHRPMS